MLRESGASSTRRQLGEYWNHPACADDDSEMDPSQVSYKMRGIPSCSTSFSTAANVLMTGAEVAFRIEQRAS